MRKLLWLLVMLPLCGRGQSHGTTLIAESGSDGVVLIGDSRAVIGSPPVAYYDSTAKIYQLSHYVLGVSGLVNFGHVSMFSIANNVDTPEYRFDMVDFCFDFFNLLKATLSKSQIDSLKDNTFLLAGSYKSKPMILKFTIQDLYNNHVYPVATYCTTQYPALEFLKYDPNLNCLELSKRAEIAIKEFAEKFHFGYMIGGPISVVQITNDNKINWIKNRLEDRVLNLNELIIRRKIKLTSINPVDVRIADSLVKAYNQTHK